METHRPADLDQHEKASSHNKPAPNKQSQASDPHTKTSMGQQPNKARNSQARAKGPKAAVHDEEAMNKRFAEEIEYFRKKDK